MSACNFPTDDDGANTDGTASEAVIATVATKTNSEPLEIGPLYDYIDLEALDGLFLSSTGKTPERLHVEFRFDSVQVMVTNDGVSVTDAQTQ